MMFGGRGKLNEMESKPRKMQHFIFDRPVACGWSNDNGRYENALGISISLVHSTSFGVAGPTVALTTTGVFGTKALLCMAIAAGLLTGPLTPIIFNVVHKSGKIMMSLCSLTGGAITTKN